MEVLKSNLPCDEAPSDAPAEVPVQDTGTEACQSMTSDVLFVHHDVGVGVLFTLYPRVGVALILDKGFVFLFGIRFPLQISSAKPKSNLHCDQAAGHAHVEVPVKETGTKACQ